MIRHIYTVFLVPCYFVKKLVGYGAGATGPVNLNNVADMVQKQRTASIKEFEISYDDDGNMWRVSGAGLQRFIQMTNWRCETCC